ncbi:MAG: DNA glycosylase AlkZ-like family protein [Acidimicrobiia bacterium]
MRAKEREWFLPPNIAEHEFDRNGNAGPTIWADSQVVGGWAQRASGDIAFDLHRDLTREHRELLADATSRIVEFLATPGSASDFVLRVGRGLLN